jgi:2-methylcitrate dehydratase PrpD
LYSSYSDGGDASRLLADIGEDWELERISLRAWPVAAYLQGLVTAMTALTAETVGPDEVSSLVVRLSPTAYELHGERVPSDRFEARLTARYVAAVVLHDRACWLGQFTAERFADPVLHAWSNETVTIVRDESIEEAGAIVEATMSDGSRRAFVAEVPKGDPHDPLSYADVAAKFSSATASDPRGDRLKEVVQTIGDLERVTSTRSITRQLLA